MPTPITPSHDAVYPSSDPTHLQQHVSFWDKDKDGVIWPTDMWVAAAVLQLLTSLTCPFSYHGFRELGFGIVLAFLSAAVISSTLSYVKALDLLRRYGGEIETSCL